jgi:oligoribonuclease NrnB/cAMP/cGMP phosphodiesterase (DHH superfamily)
MERNPLIIYHSPCADGFTAAWIAWKEFGDDAEYVAATYNDQPEIPDVDDRIVYILDFSYPAPIMRRIAERAEKVIVLDHHKSAEESLGPLLEEGVIEGEFDMDRSGAGMTWDWFNLGEPRPMLVDYVEDRDLWRYRFPNTKEVNLAMFSYPYDFETWDNLCVGELINDGRAIARKHQKDVDELKEQAMRLTIAGYHNILTVNANYFYGSDLAGQLADGEPFAAYFWMNKDEQLVFGLRSVEGQEQAVDVANIAKEFGGGGHKHASGFRVGSLDEL